MDLAMVIMSETPLRLKQLGIVFHGEKLLTCIILRKACVMERSHFANDFG